MMSVTPETWSIAAIDDVLETLNNGNTLQQGWSPQCENFSAAEGQWGVLKTTAIQDGVFQAEHNKKLPEHLEPRPKVEIMANDILMTCAGPRNRCGVTCLIKRTPEKLMMSGKIYRFRANQALMIPQYLEFFLLARDTKQAIDKMKTGISDSGLNLTHDRFKKLEVPIAPLPEQHRIVAKIEELFSELDKGVENLRTAQQQLKVYRQALLKQAFEGKLTADWRAQNPDKLEPADALLERIQQEREARYQQQLQDWQAAQKAWEVNGKTGSKPSKPKAPKTLPLLTAEELAELPFGWGWARLGDAFGVYVGATPSRKDPSFWGGLIPWVSSGEVAFCRINSTREKITELGYLSASTEIHPVGTVMLAMIGEGKTRGQPAILDIEAAHNQNTAAIRVSESNCIPEYVYFYLCLQYEITRMLGSGNNQKALNKERVSEITLPLCSVSEQKVLIQLLDEKLSIFDQLEQTITHSLQQAEALRQSILKKAFSGQLVAQDANDEPASVLLERIKAEKQAKPAAGKRTARTAPAALPNNVVPMPVRIPGIASTDLHAGILALAYSAHEAEPKYLPYFGHVKGEKVSHLVEAHLGIELDRAPVKDAAGPNDYPHLKKVESRARKVGWFDMRREPGATAYSLHKLAGFNELQVKTRQALGPRLSEVEALLRLLLPLNTRQAEIVATLYAAWNNLLLAGHQPSDPHIIFEARANWHPDKLKIEQERFEKGLSWMKAKGLVPTGQGRPVKSKPA